jgi:methionyl-tRNA formyltransferase
MRFGFVTCVELGLAAMEGIYQAGGRIDLALTFPEDRALEKSGRVNIGGFCDRHEIPLMRIEGINDPAAVAILREAQLDWLFIIGWSEIARREVLEIPRSGVLGMHPTLLPEGRGRAPIPWAILKGLQRTGVTLFKLDEGVDSGPLLDQEPIQLEEREDASMLYAKVLRAHTRLAERALPDLLTGHARFVAQNEALASYWPARKPEDGELHESLSVEEADRMVRALTRPYPGARVIAGDGKQLIVWRADVIGNCPCPGDSLILRFADGWLAITEYEIEAD